VIALLLRKARIAAVGAFDAEGLRELQPVCGDGMSGAGPAL
jgi:hypothetical protein